MTTNTNTHMATLKEINGKSSENKLEYFGEYKGVNWVISGLRDGNKVWWYLTDDIDGRIDTPAENLNDAIEFIKSNIDYSLNN